MVHATGSKPSFLADDSENDMKARELSNYMQFLDNMRY